jgi:HPt (histidine-containing phosphotransfer) domain-containing protein
MPLEKTTNPSQEKTTEKTVSPTMDFQILKKFENLMGPEVVLELIEQFLDYVPQQLAALQQSIATKNSETLRYQAHQLKGESLQIGANPLSELCQQLEMIAQNDQLESAPANLIQIEKEWSKLKITLTHQVNHNDK